MKKLIIILLFCAFTTASNAQTIKSVGLKVGRTSASQNWQYDNYFFGEQYQSIRFGNYAALSLEVFSKKRISIITDFAYCQKGYTIDVPATTSSNLTEANTYLRFGARHDYFSFSPIFKYRKENIHFIPYVMLGPRIDYQIGFHPDEFNTDWKTENFKKTLFGISTGIGLEYKFSNFGIHIEYQAQIDFTKVLASQPTSTKDYPNKNLAAVINIGFKYYLNN